MRKKTLIGISTVLCVSISGCAPAAIGAAGGAAAGGVATARSQDRGEEHGTGTYVATVLSNAFYVPAKAIVAGTGALASGATYLVTLGDREASGSVWDATVPGTYVLTPDMVAGEERIRFVG